MRSFANLTTLSLRSDCSCQQAVHLHVHERQSPTCPASLTDSPRPSFLLSNLSQHFKKPSSFSSTRSHCLTPDSEFKGKNDLMPPRCHHPPCQS